MTYEIDMRPQAIADLEGIHESLSAYSQDSADRTYALIQAGVNSLTMFPRRCALAPESARSAIEVRHLIVGNYRIVYFIIGTIVRISRIRHVAQQPLNPADLF